MIEVLAPQINVKGYEISYYWYGQTGSKEYPREIPIFAGDIMPDVRDITKRATLSREWDRHTIHLPKLRSGTKMYFTVKALFAARRSLEVSKESETVIIQTGPEKTRPSCNLQYTDERTFAMSWLDVRGAYKYRVSIRVLDQDGNASKVIKQKEFDSGYRISGTLDSQREVV